MDWNAAVCRSEVAATATCQMSHLIWDAVHIKKSVDSQQSDLKGNLIWIKFA